MSQRCGQGQAGVRILDESGLIVVDGQDALTIRAVFCDEDVACVTAQGEVNVLTLLFDELECEPRRWIAVALGAQTLGDFT